jgi:ferric-dicitrate binding protein FerR (iron transport regulator)
MDETKAKALLEKYLSGQSTPEEAQWIEQWYARLIETSDWEWDEGEKEQIREQMEQQLLEKINTERTPVRSFRAVWWAAAAVLLLLLCGGAWFYFSGEQSEKYKTVQIRMRKDILPAHQQVILTLADGSRKILDTLANGEISLQGMQVIKKDGSITYIGNQPASMVYNSITTEKGRSFRLQLADGTRVWLDAMSSIRFPAAFGGQERIVEVTGQVYFEVAAMKDANGQKLPFKVMAGHQQIEVLGTHFNVNAYEHQEIQTTLLEGKVKVSSKGNKATVASLELKPGEQSLAKENGKMQLNEAVDIDEVMAWKNGRFQFNGSTVEQIMQQLARWYNIEIVYKDEIPETFVAEMERNLPLSELLALLEMTKQVRFVVEGKKVMVMK